MKIRDLIGSLGRSLVRYSGGPATSAPPKFAMDCTEALGSEIKARMKAIGPSLRGKPRQEKEEIVRAAMADLGPVVHVTSSDLPGDDDEDEGGFAIGDLLHPVYAPDTGAVLDGLPLPFEAMPRLRRDIMGAADDARWSLGKFAVRSGNTVYAVWMIGLTRGQFGVYNKAFHCCEPVDEERILSALIHLPTGTGLGLFMTNETARAAAEIAMNMHGVDWLHAVNPEHAETWQMDLVGRLRAAWRAMDIVPAPFHSHDGNQQAITVYMRHIGVSPLSPQQKEKLS